MFSIFKRKPKKSNRDFEELAEMLWHEQRSSVVNHSFLKLGLLDYSLDSLKHVDDYLETLHESELDDNDITIVALRAGAYVGEVIRKNSETKFDWYAYEEAIKFNEANQVLDELENDLGAVGLLRAENDYWFFPIAKVIKFIVYGREDSVYSLATVAIEGHLEKAYNKDRTVIPL